jgi:hypothetical protein
MPGKAGAGAGAPKVIGGAAADGGGASGGIGPLMPCGRLKSEVEIS